MPTPDSLPPPIVADELLAETVAFPETLFQLGAAYENLAPELLELDQRKNLGIGSVVHPTPPWWVVTAPFRLARRMVDNGQYAKFWLAPDMDPDSEYKRFVQRPDVWAMVWKEARIENIRVSAWISRTERRTWVEFYGDCTNAIQAMVKGHAYEAYRAFELPFPKDAAEPSKDGVLVDWVFQLIAYFLRPFFPPDQVKAIEEQHDIADQPFPDLQAEFRSKRDELEARLKAAFLQQCDPRLVDAFTHNPGVVELLQFLERVGHYVERFEGPDILPVEAIFYPRVWETAEGPLRHGGLLVHQQVPTGKRPVMGISLYESLAYVLWVNQYIYESGWRAALPNEAEYERAASWPEGAEPQAEVALNPKLKAIFPWEPLPGNGADYAGGSADAGGGLLPEIPDFSTFFGSQARSLEGFYFLDRARFAKLLEQTGRPLHAPPEQRIEMLLGFGWQWTEDRFQESEDGYNRFEGENQQRRTDIKAYLNGQRVPVFDFFAAGFHPDWSHFVCRGAPEVIGGPATSTRRFAFNPLKGYSQVGFRYVLRENVAI